METASGSRAQSLCAGIARRTTWLLPRQELNSRRSRCRQHFRPDPSVAMSDSGSRMGAVDRAQVRPSAAVLPPRRRFTCPIAGIRLPVMRCALFASRGSGVQIPSAPPRGLHHVSVRTMFTFGSDIPASGSQWPGAGLRALRRGLVCWFVLCWGMLSPGCGSRLGGDECGGSWSWRLRVRAARRRGQRGSYGADAAGVGAAPAEANSSRNNATVVAKASPALSAG